VIAALAALGGKWLHNECAALAGLFVFGISALWVIGAATALVLDIE
jgi:hypothetical protein